jgi:hypothetical protein
MIALCLALADSIIAVLAVSIAVITLSGGGTFDIAGVRLGAHSVGAPLIALLLLAALRWWTAPAAPVLTIKRMTPQSLEERSLRLIESAVARLTGIDMRGAVSLMLVLSVTVLIVKLGAILTHPGFITGDDVEIQEMTLGHLLGTSWPVWEIRSAVYPMTVVYPAQALAQALGMTDTGTLVTVGRMAAATLSTTLIPILFVAGRRLASTPEALLMVTFASASHLLMNFGASELPRPFSAALIVAGFACLLRRTDRGGVAAGSLVGVAATLRFSELVFLVPGLVHLTVERRWRHVVLFTAGFIAAAGAIQFTADELFWGSPFHSLIRIVQYTLIDRQSSRGFEAAWHYAVEMNSWTDPVVAALAVWGTAKRAWRPAVWAWIPMLLLSLLPHKEARYLLPVLPFVAMLAGMQLWDVAHRTVTGARRDRAAAGRFALALCTVVAASLTYEGSRWHVRRSDDAVRLARALSVAPAQGGLAVEQLWRMGGHLYLGQFSPLKDLDPAALASPGGVAAAGEEPALRWIALRVQTCRTRDCAGALGPRGFSERKPPVASDYRLFGRGLEEGRPANP